MIFDIGKGRTKQAVCKGKHTIKRSFILRVIEKSLDTKSDRKYLILRVS